MPYAESKTIFPDYDQEAFDDAVVTTSRKEKILLGLIVMGVVAISLFFLSHQSLRLDEAQSLWQSARSPSGILLVIAQDVHVPLYLFLLHFWQFLFGNNVATARVLSLIFFLISLPLLFRLGKLAHNSKVAWFAVLLSAVSPFLNWYGNEIRMYSLMGVLSLLSHFYFLALYKFPNAGKHQRLGWWIGYAVSGLLGIYTHYFFWMILASQGLFYLLYRKQFVRGMLLKLILVFDLLLVAIGPWLYYVLRVVHFLGNSEPLLVKPSVIDLFNAFSQFLFGFQNDHVNTLIISLWPLTVILGFWAIRKNTKIPPETIYFLLVTFLPILSAFAISLFWKPLFLTRYLIFSTSSLYLMLGWALTTYSRKLGRILQIATVAGMCAMLVLEISRGDTPVKENYQEASTYVSETAEPQDIVIISAPFTIYPFEYYYSGKASMTTLPVWNRYAFGTIPQFSDQRLQSDMSTIETSHQKAYLLLSYDQGYEQTIKQYFDQHFPKLEQKNFSPKLDLYVYDLRGFNVVPASAKP